MQFEPEQVSKSQICGWGKGGAGVSRFLIMIGNLVALTSPLPNIVLPYLKIMAEKNNNCLSFAVSGKFTTEAWDNSKKLIVKMSLGASLDPKLLWSTSGKQIMQ